MLFRSCLIAYSANKQTLGRYKHCCPWILSPSLHKDSNKGHRWSKREQVISYYLAAVSKGDVAPRRLRGLCVAAWVYIYSPFVRHIMQRSPTLRPWTGTGTGPHSRRLDLCSHGNGEGPDSFITLELKKSNFLFISPHCHSKTNSQVSLFLAPDTSAPLRTAGECAQFVHSGSVRGTWQIPALQWQEFFTWLEYRNSTPPCVSPQGSWASSWDLVHAFYKLYPTGYKAW